MKPILIAGLDLETTGVKVHKGDKIIEVCIQLYRYKGDVMEHLGGLTQRINPLRTIHEDAQAVHGITLEDLRDMPTWPEYAPSVDGVLNKVDLMVIHNAGFDMEFLKAEQQAAGLPIKDFPVFCTMANGRWATFDGKVPQLHELAYTLGVEYDTAAAHAADYDVSVMMECFAKGLALGYFECPQLEGDKDEEGN